MGQDSLFSELRDSGNFGIELAEGEQATVRHCGSKVNI
jgi:hypothetical protein